MKNLFKKGKGLLKANSSFGITQSRSESQKVGFLSKKFWDYKKMEVTCFATFKLHFLFPLKKGFVIFYFVSVVRNFLGKGRRTSGNRIAVWVWHNPASYLVWALCFYLGSVSADAVLAIWFSHEGRKLSKLFSLTYQIRPLDLHPARPNCLRN